MRTVYWISGALSAMIFLTQCTEGGNDEPRKSTEPLAQQDTAAIRPKPPTHAIKLPDTLAYKRVAAKAWIKDNATDKDFDKVLAVNRTDTAGLKAMDSILVPVALNGDLEAYLPFPASLPALQKVNKLIIFSYPTQAFAAYENGTLQYAGVTNMGRKKDTTPTGLFFCNWKAEETTSTFNDEWNLRWNFNVENKLGVGFHQYAMPGYPASHSCMRLMEKDAKFLYGWAEQWVLDDKDENIELAKGTPVVVLGRYPFGKAKPWLALKEDAHALNYDVEELQQQLNEFLPEIIDQQIKRAAVLAGAKTTASRP